VNSVPFIAAVAVLAAAITPAPLARFEFAEPHMGTTFRVVLYAESQASAESAARQALDRVAELDARLSDYRADSELSRLTAEAVGRPVPVSADLLHLLERAQDLARDTDGAFDVTVGPLSHLWRRARRQVALPADSELAAARSVTGYRLLHVDTARGTVVVDRPGMRLDPGGIAKGFAADAALAVLAHLDVPRALVAAGGDLSIGAPPPEAGGWDVVLAGLEPDRPAPGSPLLLAHCGVSTSGDAEQWVEIGGVRYSHIVDPRTGLGLTGHASVTVIAPDATTSDMLATAVSVLGPEDGRHLIERRPGTSALIGRHTSAGDRWVRSAGWPAHAARGLPRRPH
jgi:thiamine biosynthesis lipoprotein